MKSTKSSELPMGALVHVLGSLPELYKVSIEEGCEPEMILTTPALNARFDRAGERLLYEDNKSYENLWRKHNTSSLAHDVWLFDQRSGHHTKLTGSACENRNPVWAPEENAFFYLSEQSGSFNVWKQSIGETGNAAPQQITHFERNPVRFLSIAANGVDWDYYKTVYARFLPFITDNYDFAEMTSEMLGELNASHTGCFLWPSTTGDQTASLGAFFDQSYRGSGLKIEEVIEEGPLTQTNPPLQAGMIIEKIDNQTITPGMDFSPLLNFKADKLTALSTFDPGKNAHFVVTTKPITVRELDALLYKRWVRQRRELVDKLSNGQIGYVHVAQMGDASYRDAYAEAPGRQVDKKALIVDTRWNPGGHMHDELATFLSGKEYLEYVPRGQVLGPDPHRKWYRKTALLVNEGTTLTA
jgi:C-terminal processing protease CtpA/Prc